jgi:cell division protein FtsI (penicillin-binding protein 3)
VRARGAVGRAPRYTPAPAPRAPRRQPAPSPPRTAHPKRRLALCSAIVVVVFVVLAGRVAQLQLMSGDYYQRQVVKQTLHTIPIHAERGSLFDRNGRDLALSVRRSTVYADPTLVLDPAATAAKLAPVLHVDEQYLRTQLSAKPSRFAYLAHTVDDDVVAAVKRLGSPNMLGLPGIGFVPESRRSYPAGSLAGALIGRVGVEGKGLDGLEYLYDRVLSGKRGELVVEQDPDGHDIPNTQRARVVSRRGTDVALTIDQNLQWESEYALLDQVQATRAKGGMAAVVDVTNGDVLAMATVHGTTATRTARVAKPDERNAPLTELFEPGSTTKLITLAWAIEHGRVSPETKFTVPYSIQVERGVKPYYDSKWHTTRQMTVADILRESSNVGTIKIAQLMKNNEMADAVRAFGLGTRTTIDWPGQPDGLMLPPSQYYATGKYATAIGYGASVTGMQMLGAFTTIANGGVTRPAHLLGSTIDANGIRHPAAVPKGRRVVSGDTARTMTRMMEGVVANGTGACAAIPGYPVAGKTGTSKKLLKGAYSSTATMASFIGFAPSDNPRFAAIVVLDQPAGDSQFGGASAAPVWSEIMQFALMQYGVPPTDVTDAQFGAARGIAQHPCTVPHGADLAKAVAARFRPNTSPRN